MLDMLDLRYFIHVLNEAGIPKLDPIHALTV